MIVNQLDLGGSHPWLAPDLGQMIGEVLIEGYDTAVWPRGALSRKQTVGFRLIGWQAIGGAPANSQLATQYLLKQVEELAANRDLQPCYIQWSATAQPGAALNAVDLHDGWYTIDGFRPDYANYVVTGIVDCSMTVTFVAPAAPHRMALWYSGAGLSTNYTGAGINLVALPLGATALEASFTRIGGEGAIPCISAPAASPEHFILSATLASTWKGGVHVYDTINTGTNPVPSAASGLFVNANWVELFGTDHDFVGDCVITNGLQLLLFQTGQTNLCLAYLWNTSAASVGWQQYGTLILQSNGAANSSLRSYSLIRVGPEEAAMSTISAGSDSQVQQVILRLQRGHYEVRTDLRPLSQASVTASSLILQLPATYKIEFNSMKAGDNAISETAPVVATDYGYGAAFITSTTYPLIAGFLYQNKPGTSQPGGGANNANVGLGDTTSLAINAQRSYGFFAVPYGVSGSSSPANLQLLATAATAVGTTSTAADAASSGGTVVRAQGNQPPTATGISTTETGTGLANGDTYFPAIRARCSLANASARLKIAGIANGPVVDNVFRWLLNSIATTATGSATDQFLLAEEIYLTTVATPAAIYAFTAPVHYYRLGEASGTVATDAMGNGNGTYTGSGITYGVTGIGQNTDKAVTLASASSAKVGAIPITSLSTGAGAWSLEAWVNAAAFSTNEIIASYGDGNVAHGCARIWIDTTGKPKVDDGTTSIIATSAISTSAWHHIVGTYDGANLNLYVDASLVAGPTAAAANIQATANSGRIGCNNSNGTDINFFNGSIDEVAFYNYALTAAQVTAHFNAGSVATYLHLDEIALLPATRAAAKTGPQDIFQQFLFDRGVRWLQP